MSSQTLVPCAWMVTGRNGKYATLAKPEDKARSIDALYKLTPEQVQALQKASLA